AEDGPVTNGKATVTDSKVTGNVYGGYAEDGPVLDSLAWIESSNASNVYGGYAEDGPVTNGKATVTDSNVTGNVYGGYAEDGPVLDSLVLLMDSNASNVYGGYSENGPVTNGHVGVIESDIRGNVSGGYSKNGSVTSGSALVSFSAVNQDVYGGYALNGSANDNDVEVIESVANRVIGGYSDDYGDAVSNSVLVDSSAIATVIGGYSEVGGANNNYVVLTGNSTVSTLLAGGKMGSGSNGDAYVKNTLVLWDYEASATPIPLVNNFQYYNYYLPSTVDDGFVALRATTVDLGPNPAVQWIEIDAQYGIPEIYNGEEIILIDASSIAGNFPLSAVVADIGFFFEKDFEVSLNAAKTQLIATVASPYRVKDRAKIVTETSAARLALLTQGQDYLVDHGLSLAKARADTPDDLVAFAGTSVTRGRYATGSHVDLTGVNGLIGVSKGQGVAGNHLTFGLFSEFGFGVYDAYVRAQGEGVEAEGDVSYVGAGLLGRYDIPANFGSYYLEASTRFGKSKADFVSKAGFNGRKLRFETSGSYAGFHLGGGLVYKITEATDIDLNLRYLWNRQQGSKERLLGQKFTLDDVESSRVRTGVRLSHKVNDYVKLYVGGAYIYELAGETGGHVIGLSLPSASLRGATGLTEVGLTLLKPVTFPISLDLGIQGYFGRRKGLAGALQLNYEF
ncbi:MAG: hypothetical protein LBS60_03140, partial [Deltaproteobacteria bacterium]|nr:hypothetical protein [Deltaproteobacteria bacterium]